MYHIKKHQDRWTIHNDDNGGNRALTWLEMLIVMIEFPELGCQQVSTVYASEIKSIEEKP